jgi:tripartite-type tricarboxylate transporter receptor subunit TctC
MKKIWGICLPLLTVLLASPTAAAPVSFQGKTVTLIVPYAAGGGTDTAGRLVAEYFARLLPGKPSVIVRNMPGADGKAGMNYFVQQVKPDGYTLAVGTGTSSDPLHYRKPQARFDPTKFAFIGGLGRGGYVLLIDKNAEPRLYDKSAPPVTMGTLSGLQRAAMSGTVWGIEFLGWNARWITGYPGTNQLVLALERGEIDMTATGISSQIRRLLDTGKIKILTSFDSAGVVRSEFGEVPVFANMLKGKIKDPTMQRAFEYYLSMMAIDKWVALPPGAPEPLADAYRLAFDRMSQDPEFLDRGRKMSEEFVPMTRRQVEALIEGLGDTPSEAIRFVDTLYKKQGLLAE